MLKSITFPPQRDEVLEREHGHSSTAGSRNAFRRGQMTPAGLAGSSSSVQGAPQAIPWKTADEEDTVSWMCSSVLQGHTLHKLRWPSSRSREPSHFGRCTCRGHNQKRRCETDQVRKDPIHSENILLFTKP